MQMDHFRVLLRDEEIVLRVGVDFGLHEQARHLERLDFVFLLLLGVADLELLNGHSGGLEVAVCLVVEVAFLDDVLDGLLATGVIQLDVVVFELGIVDTFDESNENSFFVLSVIS